MDGWSAFATGLSLGWLTGGVWLAVVFGRPAKARDKQAPDDSGLDIFYEDGDLS